MSSNLQGKIKQVRISGEEIWKTKMEKINAELFTLTYGSLVLQLFKDCENWTEVNKQLDTMGYNIGTRLIEEFLAKSGATKCQDFKETVDWITKVGFRMFLNIAPTVTNWSQDNKECTLIIDHDQNPLTDFVELPEEALNELWYANLLCGVICGALEMVHMEVDARFISDVLRGNETTEMRLKFIKMLDEEVPAGED